MSRRNWKSSSNSRIRRRTSDAPSVISTTSSNTTVSVSNRTVGDEESSEKVVASSFLTSSSNQNPHQQDSIQPQKSQQRENSRDLSRELPPPIPISGNASASSMDTYDYAFMLSPAQGSVKSKHTTPDISLSTEKNRSNKFLSTVDENSPISNTENSGKSSFLETLFGDDGEEGFDEDDDKKIHHRTHLSKITHFIRTKIIKRRNKNNTDHYSRSASSRRRKTTTGDNPYSSKNTQLSPLKKWILSLFKFAWFIGLVLAIFGLLRLAIQNEPEMVDYPHIPTQGEGKFNLKNKLLRRRFQPPPKVVPPINENMILLNKNNMINSQHNNNGADSRHIGARIPPAFLNLADVDDPQNKKALPFFWHVPRSGGTTVDNILSKCLNLVLASNVGGLQGHNEDPMLQVVPFGSSKFVNVDVSTPAGIERAKKLNFANSGLADVMISTRIYDASLLFSPVHHGRLFALLRHPVDRAVSLFYYTQDTVWRRGNVENLKDVTIEEYFKSGGGENNCESYNLFCLKILHTLSQILFLTSTFLLLLI